MKTVASVFSNGIIACGS